MFEAPLERPIARLHVAVLLLLADLRRPRPHPVVPHERQILGVEWTAPRLIVGLGVSRHVVRRRGRVIRLVPRRYATELEECRLHALDEGRPFPPRGKRSPTPSWSTAARTRRACATKSCPQIVTPSSVAHVKSVCAASPGRCACAKNTSLSGPACAPHLDAALKRPQLTLLVPTRMLLEQPLEDRLRLEAGLLLQLLHDLGPVLLERILARAPRARLPHLRRELPRRDVLARRLPIHIGLVGGAPDLAVLAQLFHQFPHLPVARPHPRVPPRDRGYRGRKPRLRMGRCSCRPWGGLIVVEQRRCRHLRDLRTRSGGAAWGTRGRRPRRGAQPRRGSAQGSR